MVDSEERLVAVRLANYVRDAVKFRQRLAGWERDSLYIAAGGRIIYSIDIDVVNLYLDPAKMAVPRVEGGRVTRQGYTQIFQHDEASTAVALADAVCEAIFFPRFDRAIGAIIVPPLQRELDDIMHALLARARDLDEGEMQRPFRDEVLRWKFTSNELTTQKKYDLLRLELPSIAAHFLDDTGPLAEIRRLNVLSRFSTLMTLDRFVASRRPNFPELAEMSTNKLVSELLAFASIKREVFSSLIVQRKDRDKSNNDAEVISRIAMLNKRMERHNIRIVHVTGAESLFAAAGRLKAGVGLNDNTGAPTPDESFSEMFLRHPSSFLAAPSVVFPARSGGLNSLFGSSGITSWLDVFLTEFDTETDLSSDAIVDRALQALRRDPSALREFEERWRAFVEPVVIKRLEASQQRYSYVGGSVFASLREYVEAEIAQTWNRWLETATATAYNFTEGAGYSHNWGPPRDVPLIWFDCAPTADEVIAGIQQSLNIVSGDGFDRGSYQTSISELRRLDDQGYFYFVAFGVLFASLNRWKTALILAERSIRIADNVRSESGPSKHIISGREAYYLASVAKKNVARAPAEFESAEAYLGRALELLEEDRLYQVTMVALAEQVSLSSLRFDAEALSLELARYLFRHFNAPEGPPPSALAWPAFAERMDGLLKRLGEEQSERIGKSLERRLLVNFVSRFLHDPDWREVARRTPGIAAGLRARVAQLEAALAGVSSRSVVPMTYLHRAVVIAATFVINPPTSRGALRKLTDSAHQLFTAHEIGNNLVMAYDAQRFAELKALCNIDY